MNWISSEEEKVENCTGSLHEAFIRMDVKYKANKEAADLVVLCSSDT